MRKKIYWLSLVILVLVLASLACSLPSGDDGDEPASGEDNGDNGQVTEVVNVQTDEPPAEDNDGNTEPDTPPTGGDLNLADPSLYSSPSNTNFYSSMDISFTALDVFGRINVEGAKSVDPPPAFGYTFLLEGEAVVDGMDTLELANINGTDYVFIPGLGCIAFGGDELIDIYDDLIDSSELLTGEAQLLESGVMINGVATDHYKIDESNVDTGDPGSEDYLEEIEDGNLYVAVDGGYIVRMVIDGRGVSSALSGDATLVGDLHYELNFTPTNDAVVVSPPAGCEEASETEFPVLDDAYDINTFPGFYSYSTNYSFDDVVDFYKTEMAAAGWDLGDELLLAPLATLSFSMDGRSAEIMIFDGGEGILVTIGEELN
ncbi:MAG: hypothetical protein FVQ83_03825 [Chloroflexi bacterium]|nr:hypothetical protein [Chloroflexota bacterium]